MANPYAVILHMIETARADDGRVGVIVPHGVLLRGGSEGAIRRPSIEGSLFRDSSPAGRDGPRPRRGESVR